MIKSIFYMLPLLLVTFCNQAPKPTVETETANLKITNEMTSNKLVVAELFTSQGCSSCPPAEELLGSFSKQNPNLVLLSFHVDYWDYLGWKDVFGNADYSNRKKQYGTIFNISSIYTPQLIINGKSEFVGSNQGKLNTEYSNKAIEISNENEIKILNLKKSEETVSCSYSINNLSKQTKYLNVALVSNEETTKVARGENRGETLKSYNVVKYFKVMTPKTSGEIIFEQVSKNIDKIIIYTQTENLEILDCTLKTL